jgi:hypothetical protein
MANDPNKGYVTKSGLIVTPKGRMLYPGLFHKSLPKGETDEKKASYQLTLIFPKIADMSILTKAVNDAAAAKWGAPPAGGYKFKWKKPFLDVKEQPRFAELADDYPVMLRAGNKEKPAIVFASLAPCLAEEEVYGGRWATMSLNAYAWEHPTGGKGVSLGLNHVMLLDHDEPMGGGRVRVEDTFEAVDGGGAAVSSDALF